MAEVLLDGYDFCGQLRNAIAAEKALLHLPASMG